MRAAGLVFAAAFGTILTACSGGGSSTIPQSTVRQQPAQPPSSTTTESLIKDSFKPSATAGYKISNYSYHVMPVYKAGSASTHARTPATTVYPMDLSYGGGPLMSSATVHNVYINCPTGPHCWGTPADFLISLGQSRMLQVARQYNGQQTLKLGQGMDLSVPLFSNTVYDNDLLAYLHHAVQKIGGTGLTHIYNLFLPPGLDTCFDQTSECYSPDNLSNFAFCGYHSAVQYSDVGVVIFTVEPYQGVTGCDYLNETDLNSATANVLSHEIFETITDPYPGYGWVNYNGFGEIGDECAWTSLTDETFGATGSTYHIQLEYSNAVHACSDQPTKAPTT